jgi:putative heme-binding domain-containing protein
MFATLLALCAVRPGPEAAPDPAHVRAAAERALTAIQKSTEEYPKHRDCFSCHHQAAPTLALTLAKRRGFTIDEESLRAQAELTHADLHGAVENYRQGRDQGGGATRAGYALWTLELGGWKPDETTAAVVSFLLQRDKDRDHWGTSSRRPPSESSDFTTTYVALRALRTFGTPEENQRIAARRDRVRRWLIATPGRETEDRVFRLWGLKDAGAGDAEIQAAVKELCDSQRPDGGWPQIDRHESDAYATGSALVALQLQGGLCTDDAVYRKGIAYLLHTQREDGTWHVKSRSKPFQTYFESGFPHGPDQFISMAASSWAAAALVLAAAPARAEDVPSDASKLFARDNLIAWCIVPFDAKRRGPEERAAMLQRLGFKHFAYDWRAESIPTFDAEIKALKAHSISLDAFWLAPGELTKEARTILDVLERHGVRTQLWVLLDLGPDRVTGPEQERRVASATEKLRPLAEEARKIGCKLALYNHGGWFGEPENQLAILERLEGQGVTNVGIIYNLHHGHEHLDRLAEVLAKLKPHLWTINLNGMDRGGDKVGRKILPLGQGALDLEVLKTVRDSGYRGPIGILGHTMDDAEERLRDNLDGLDWLVPQLEAKPAGPQPKPRTPVPPKPPEQASAVQELLRAARERGDPRRGAEVFASPKSACLSCHRVGDQGGTVGPDLTTAGACVPPEELVEAILWPRKKVKEGYAAITVVTDDGKSRQGYRLDETAKTLALRDPTSGDRIAIPKSEIEAVREDGTLMPEGLSAVLSPAERGDLVRFLLELRPSGISVAKEALRLAHAPAGFSYDRAPLHPEFWPSWQHPVNRDRIYDFYAKEAEFFRTQPSTPALLAPFPGLDGGKLGHWGNQSERNWADARWNQTDLGTLLCGVFRGAGVTVPKAVCVRLGEHGELSACFNPETLAYEAVWSGGFVKFTATRHGFMDGLIMDGTALPKPEVSKPEAPFVYHGFYRHRKRVIFSYRVGDVEMLDAPWVEDGRLTRTVAPATEHPLAKLTRGGSPLWTETIATRGTLGAADAPYVVDTIEVPFRNPWNALMFFGGHDFLPDGSALLCTMQGDVWRVEGLDAKLEHVRWRRFASGLHQALGLVVADGVAYVLGRDQITRLRDQDGDGEADFYECVSNAYTTSTAGHDFICGLERDAEGRFYTVSGKQGLLRIGPNGVSVQKLATGFRNADGLGLAPNGTVTVPNSEGEWVPASMVCEVRPGGHYGYPGPREDRPPDLPLVYLPRGLDNSSGGQVFATTDRFGPLHGKWIHLSFGAGTAFAILRDEVDLQPQGAALPLPFEFRSGAHRGRFSPADGQLYVSGMAGWGTYTPDDGCFQRVRYTCRPAPVPTEFRVHENGVLLTFALPLDRAVAGIPRSHFAQAWNYRYSAGYGSPELSPSHPGTPGHDPVAIRSAHVLEDGRSLFLELPDLQPVSQLHLHLRPDSGPPVDLFATVHRWHSPFTGFPGYAPAEKTVAIHPILRDMAALANPPPPNPWRGGIAGAREIALEAGKNLSYSTRTLKVKAGEPIKLTFLNPDVVPHNWALIKPGSLARVGDLVNKIVAEPDATLRQYVPRSDDVLVYTDIVGPQDQQAIFFRAPSEPGGYPYLCTFPGHWMVMNGEMIVE